MSASARVACKTGGLTEKSTISVAGLPLFDDVADNLFGFASIARARNKGAGHRGMCESVLLLLQVAIAKDDRVGMRSDEDGFRRS